MVAGWLYPFGLFSAFLFGILHSIFISQILKRYPNLTKSLRLLCWIGLICFPLIFIFQFDFGDNSGSFFDYEYLTGDSDSEFEIYGFWIAILAAIVYITNLILWIKKNKNTVANKL